MDLTLRAKLIEEARKRISLDDASHDFQHTYRVLVNAERIAENEGGDLSVIVPAALFHDLIVYPKDHINRNNSQKDSAAEGRKILICYKYLERKIELVETAILECSFSRNIDPSTLESSILQDADKLESTGVISIMRTFSSTGQMKRPFYDPVDPFCEKREPNDKEYALDLFYTRLLLAKERLHTETAKNMANKRHNALIYFLDQLKSEIY